MSGWIFKKVILTCYYCGAKLIECEKASPFECLDKLIERKIRKCPKCGHKFEYKLLIDQAVVTFD